MRFYFFALLVLATTLAYSLAISEKFDDSAQFPSKYNPIRHKRGISIGGDNHGDIHAPCTAVVCNKKKREVHFESEDKKEGNQKFLENLLADKTSDSHFRQKRAWNCVGHCGDVRILGNRLIRSGGDDTCVCLEV